MRRFVAAWLFIFSLPVAFCGVASGDSPMRLPVPEVETLPNGLTLVWFLNQSLPVIDMNVLVKSGFRDDPLGKTGTAELVANLVDRGAGGLNARQIAKAVEDLGATRFAGVEEETFSIGMHGLAPDGPTLLELMAKMVIQPEFPAAEVRRESDRMLDRWSHIGDYGETLVGLAYRRLLTAGTSYARGSLLSANEFRKINRDDVLAYHRRHFTPKNSVLMVVGQVDKAAFRARIEALFGQWTGEVPAREWKNFKDPRLTFKKGQVIVVDRPGLTQAQVRIGLRAPLIQAPEHYPLVVANAMLGEYFNSRLNSLVRDKLGLTYSINSGFSFSKDLATFTISSATRNQTVGQLIRKSIDVVKDMKKGPIPADETRMAREYLVGGFPLRTSTLGAVAGRWLGGYIFDLGPDYLNEFIPRVEKVVSADIVAALSKWLDPEQFVIVAAGDANAIEKSLKESKFTSIKRISVKELQ